MTTTATTENEAVVLRFYEEVGNRGNLSLIDALFAPDYCHHQPSFPPEWLEGGRESYKRVNETFIATFDNFHITVQDILASGDKVVSRWSFTGTHVRTFGGIPPTGKRVDVSHIMIHRLAGGKIVEGWVNYDALGLLQQLGAIPTE